MSTGIFPGVERRELVRRRTLFSGRVCYGPHYAFSLDCGIRNLTKRGAMIRVAANQPLPSELALIHIGEGQAYLAQVRWRRADLVGLRLERCEDLRGAVSAELKPLHDIWAALAPL
jgi:hypothetical protein